MMMINEIEQFGNNLSDSTSSCSCEEESSSLFDEESEPLLYNDSEDQMILNEVGGQERCDASLVTEEVKGFPSKISYEMKNMEFFQPYQPCVCFDTGFTSTCSETTDSDPNADLRCPTEEQRVAYMKTKDEIINVLLYDSYIAPPKNQHYLTYYMFVAKSKYFQNRGMQTRVEGQIAIRKSSLRYVRILLHSRTRQKPGTLTSSSNECSLAMASLDVRSHNQQLSNHAGTFPLARKAPTECIPYYKTLENTRRRKPRYNRGFPYSLKMPTVVLQLSQLVRGSANVLTRSVKSSVQFFESFDYEAALDSIDRYEYERDDGVVSSALDLEHQKSKVISFIKNLVNDLLLPSAVSLDVPSGSLQQDSKSRVSLFLKQLLMETLEPKLASEILETDLLEHVPSNITLPSSEAQIASHVFLSSQESKISNFVRSLILEAMQATSALDCDEELKRSLTAIFVKQLLYETLEPKLASEVLSSVMKEQLDERNSSNLSSSAIYLKGILDETITDAFDQQQSSAVSSETLKQPIYDLEETKSKIRTFVKDLVLEIIQPDRQCSSSILQSQKSKVSSFVKTAIKETLEPRLASEILQQEPLHDVPSDVTLVPSEAQLVLQVILSTHKYSISSFIKRLVQETIDAVPALESNPELKKALMYLLLKQLIQETLEPKLAQEIIEWLEPKRAVPTSKLSTSSIKASKSNLSPTASSLKDLLIGGVKEVLDETVPLEVNSTPIDKKHESDSTDAIATIAKPSEHAAYMANEQDVPFMQRMLSDTPEASPAFSILRSGSVVSQKRKKAVKIRVNVFHSTLRPLLSGHDNLEVPEWTQQYNRCQEPSPEINSNDPAPVLADIPPTDVIVETDESRDLVMPSKTEIREYQNVQSNAEKIIPEFYFDKEIPKSVDCDRTLLERLKSKNAYFYDVIVKQATTTNITATETSPKSYQEPFFYDTRGYVYEGSYESSLDCIDTREFEHTSMELQSFPTRSSTTVIHSIDDFEKYIHTVEHDGILGPQFHKIVKREPSILSSELVFPAKSVSLINKPEEEPWILLEEPSKISSVRVDDIDPSLRLLISSSNFVDMPESSEFGSEMPKKITSFKEISTSTLPYSGSSVGTSTMVSKSGLSKDVMVPSTKDLHKISSGVDQQPAIVSVRLSDHKTRVSASLIRYSCSVAIQTEVGLPDECSCTPSIIINLKSIQSKNLSCACVKSIKEGETIATNNQTSKSNKVDQLIQAGHRSSREIKMTGSLKPLPARSSTGTVMNQSKASLHKTKDKPLSKHEAETQKLSVCFESSHSKYYDDCVAVSSSLQPKDHLSSKGTSYMQLRQLSANANQRPEDLRNEIECLKLQIKEVTRSIQIYSTKLKEQETLHRKYLESVLKKRFDNSKTAVDYQSPIQFAKIKTESGGNGSRSPCPNYNETARKQQLLSDLKQSLCKSIKSTKGFCTDAQNSTQILECTSRKPAFEQTEVQTSLPEGLCLQSGELLKDQRPSSGQLLAIRQQLDQIQCMLQKESEAEQNNSPSSGDEETARKQLLLTLLKRCLCKSIKSYEDCCSDIQNCTETSERLPRKQLHESEVQASATKGFHLQSNEVFQEQKPISRSLLAIQQQLDEIHSMLQNNSASPQQNSSKISSLVDIFAKKKLERDQNTASNSKSFQDKARLPSFLSLNKEKQKNASKFSQTRREKRKTSSTQSNNNEPKIKEPIRIMTSSLQTEPVRTFFMLNPVHGNHGQFADFMNNKSKQQHTGTQIDPTDNPGERKASIETLQNKNRTFSLVPSLITPLKYRRIMDKTKRNNPKTKRSSKFNSRSSSSERERYDGSESEPEMGIKVNRNKQIVLKPKNIFHPLSNRRKTRSVLANSWQDELNLASLKQKVADIAKSNTSSRSSSPAFKRPARPISSDSSVADQRLCFRPTLKGRRRLP